MASRLKLFGDDEFSRRNKPFKLLFQDPLAELVKDTLPGSFNSSPLNICHPLKERIVFFNWYRYFSGGRKMLNFGECTLLETNIATENRPVVSPLPPVFRVKLLVLGAVYFRSNLELYTTSFLWMCG